MTAGDVATNETSRQCLAARCLRFSRATVVALIVGSVAVVLMLPDGLGASPPSSPAEDASCDGSFRLHATYPDVKFVDVDLISPSDIWAVGTHRVDEYEPEYTAGTPTPFVVHYDGVTWQTVEIPEVQSESVPVAAVAASRSDNIWVVGQERWAARYDGRAWTRIAMPDLAGYETFVDAAAWAPEDGLWVVGYRGVGSGGRRFAFALHYDGTRWWPIEVPIADRDSQGRPLQHVLTTLSGSGPDDVWAGGLWAAAGGHPLGAALIRWNGVEWRRVRPPRRIRAFLADDLHDPDAYPNFDARLSAPKWLLGKDSQGPVAIGWSGQWSSERIPSAATLLDLYAFEASDVWAVGHGFTRQTGVRARAVRFANGSWARVKAPFAGELQGVVADGSGSAWAVGTEGGTEHARRATGMIARAC